MAVPTKYTPGYSYSGFESANPALPKPGAQLDNDFAGISQSIDETIDALNQVRRSDGALANGVVGPDQLSETLVLGFTLKGGWADATAYNAGDGVTYGNTFYKANVTHTSAPGSRPDLDSTTWSFLLTFSAIALTDGSVTPVKLDATAAAGFRDVIGQEETVAEGVANVTAKATPVDADKLPLVDSENSGNLRGLTFSALATWVGAKLGPLVAAQTAKTTPVDADTFGIADSAASSATKKLAWSDLKAGIWTALGSLINGGTSKTTPVDADTLPLSDSAASSATKKLTWANLKATLQTFFDLRYRQVIPGLLSGLTLSNNATDATNDIDISAGAAADGGNTDHMVLSAALTKRLDAAWAVGSGNGGLDTGAIANTTYHVWLIKRPDTGVVDALFSTSATAPTMPANYTLKRRIGSIVRTGGAIKAFLQDGDYFWWSTPVADVSASNPGTSAVTRTLTLPTGIVVEAIVLHGLLDVSTAVPSSTGLLSALAGADVAPASLGINDVQMTNGGSNVDYNSVVRHVLTNTSAQIRSRLSKSDADISEYINTFGYVDQRGRA